MSDKQWATGKGEAGNTELHLFIYLRRLFA